MLPMGHVQGRKITPTPYTWVGFLLQGHAPPSSRVALSFGASPRPDPMLGGVLMYRSGSFVACRTQETDNTSGKYYRFPVRQAHRTGSMQLLSSKRAEMLRKTINRSKKSRPDPQISLWIHRLLILR